METEKPYFDENGLEIKEFAVIRVFHFIGARKKRHYMYKWVRIVEIGNSKRWVALHLTNDTNDYYQLSWVADKETRIIKGTIAVQQF